MEKTFRHFCLKVQVDPELKKAFESLKKQQQNVKNTERGWTMNNTDDVKKEERIIDDFYSWHDDVEIVDEE